MLKDINLEKIRTELVEVNIGALTTAGYNFGQQPSLREAKRIVSVEVYSATQVSKSPTNKTVVSEAVISKTFLRLVALGQQDVTLHTIPLFDLMKQYGGQVNNLVIEKINAQPIDWEKSTFQTVETTGLSVNESFLFKVVYEKK